MYHIFVSHSSLGGENLDCFLVLAIVNSATRNIGVALQFSLDPSSGIAGSYGSAVFFFFFILFKEPPYWHLCFPSCRNIPLFTLSPPPCSIFPPSKHSPLLDTVLSSVSLLMACPPQGRCSSSVKRTGDVTQLPCSLLHAQHRQ